MAYFARPGDLPLPLSKQRDGWWERPTSDLAPLLRSNPDVQVQSSDPALCGLLRFNHLQPPFDTQQSVAQSSAESFSQTSMLGGGLADNKACGAMGQVSFNRLAFWLESWAGGVFRQPDLGKG